MTSIAFIVILFMAKPVFLDVLRSFEYCAPVRKSLSHVAQVKALFFAEVYLIAESFIAVVLAAIFCSHF